MSMPWEWSRWHRGSITLLSTIWLLNEYTDEEWNAEDIAATRTWLWGNAILWGPELFGGVATKFWGAPPAAYGSFAAGYVLGVAGTYVAIELMADTPEQKKSMRADAKALFAPQFLGGESWEELDYLGTVGPAIQSEITEPIIDYLYGEIWKKQLVDPLTQVWRVTQPRIPNLPF